MKTESAIHIELCKELNFDFVIPFNLDEDTGNLNNEEVEELDIESDEDDYESQLVVVVSSDEEEDEEE